MMMLLARSSFPRKSIMSAKSRSAMEPILTKWLKPMFWVPAQSSTALQMAPLWDKGARPPPRPPPRPANRPALGQERHAPRLGRMGRKAGVQLGVGADDAHAVGPQV